MVEHKCFQKEAMDKNCERLYNVENKQSLLEQKNDLSMAEIRKDIKEIKDNQKANHLEFIDLIKEIRNNSVSKSDYETLESRVSRNEDNFDKSKTWLLVYAIGVIGAILLGLYQAFISKLFK